jgi:mono/diheme cytochrome c family protein
MRLRSRVFSLPVFLIGGLLAIWVSAVVPAGQTRTVNDGVYTEAQAQRGQTAYQACVACHGATLEGGLGPPLTGSDFVGAWSSQPLSDLVTKIQNTMPQSDPGTLTAQQVSDIVSFILRANKFPAGTTELSTNEDALQQIKWPSGNAAAPTNPVTTTSTTAPVFPAVGNLAQMMRGILFPSSNIVFNVQGQDPGGPRATYTPGSATFSWVDWGAGIYSGWELVDFAAISVAEAAPLLLTPGRRCENGRPVPVERADWIQFTKELVEAGRASYRASQTRSQEAVSASTDRLAEACASCHAIYRDKPGGTPTDPSNKAARCVP